MTRIDFSTYDYTEIEAVLYGRGSTLSGRKTMVFGAGGNIGRFLCEKSPRDKTRIHEKKLIKINLKYAGEGKYEYRTLNDVPEKLFLGTDNFLYYGVPAESMDSIISQQTRLSLGIVGRYRKKILPERGIYAVDREIDEWARPISAPDGIEH